MGGYSSPERLLDDPDSPVPEGDGSAASDMAKNYADCALHFNNCACALLLAALVCFWTEPSSNVHGISN